MHLYGFGEMRQFGECRMFGEVCRKFARCSLHQFGILCGDVLFAFGEACRKFGQVFAEGSVLPVCGHTPQAVNDMAVDDRHDDPHQDEALSPPCPCHAWPQTITDQS